MASEALEEKKQEGEAPVEENQEEEEANAEEPGEDLPKVEGKATENKVAGEEGEEETPKKAKRARKASSKSPGELKKRGGDSAVEKKEPVTPVSERPTRERKLVERYSAPDSGRSSATKPLSIEKGSGTQLKDIPNVAFKLSKRKGDESLQLLHTILFGKKAKAHTLKRNIFQFSGYVWAENEQEKQRTKVKEKLDKCVKEKLMDFCDVLDIQITKHSTKKEEVSAKLLEFLESPHATTDVLLAEKEQKGKKNKKKVTPSKSAGSGEGSPETPAKKRKDPPSVEKNDESTKEEDEFDDKVEPSGPKDEPLEEDDDRMNEETDHGHKSDEEEDEQKDQVSSPKSSSKDAKEGSKAKSGGKSTPAKKKTPAKSAKTPTDSEKKSRSTSKRGASDGDGASGSKAKGSVKKQKTEKESSKDSKAKSTSKKQSSKSPGKDQVKGKNSKKAKAEPTKEDVHAVIVDILKEVDFNTATLSDILRQLGDHFGIDLMHRKAEVKDIITDVINNMTDEEEEDEDEEAAGDDSVNDA